MHLEDSNLSQSDAAASHPAVTAPVRITAVIPVYNRAKTVGRSLETALSQSEPADEILVVDDGSKDNSAEVVKAFGDKVTYIYQENAGASEARNTGVAQAQHPWIAFLDSDDYWTPDHLRNMRRAVAETGGAAKFYAADTQLEEHLNGQRLWDRCEFKVDGDYELVDNGGEWVMCNADEKRERMPFMLQASLFDKEAYLAAGGLWRALKLRHDSHIFLKMGFQNPICAVNHLGVVMTCDEGENRLTSIHHLDSLSFWKEAELLYQDLLDTVPQISTEHRLAIRYRLASAFIAMGRLNLNDGKRGPGIRNYLKAATISPRRLLEGIAKKF